MPTHNPRLRQYFVPAWFPCLAFATPNVNQASTPYSLSSPLRQSSFLNLIPRYVPLHSFPDPSYLRDGHSLRYTMLRHSVSSFRSACPHSRRLSLPKAQPPPPHKRSAPTHKKGGQHQSPAAHSIPSLCAVTPFTTPAPLFLPDAHKLKLCKLCKLCKSASQ
jgi:hypothetical protein